MYDPDAQKLRCAATAAKWRIAYRNRRAAAKRANLVFTLDAPVESDAAVEALLAKCADA